MTTKHTPVSWLRMFEVAAQHLSFSAAAAQLHVTPSAVSQQVRLLEHRLGQELFHRHGRGLRLSVAGEALVPVCRESFQRLDAALLELFGDQRNKRLIIRVALGFARHWLLDALAGFSAAHPQVAVRLLASVWAGEPLDAHVALDIRLASGPVAGMACHQLTHDAWFPVCSPALNKGAGRSKKPAALPDLQDLPLLHTIGFAQSWPHWLKAAGIQRKARSSDIEFDSLQLSMEMAALGHGVALTRSSYAADLIRSGHLVAPFETQLKARDNVFLLHAPGLDPQSPAALFRDWLLAQPQHSPGGPALALA